MSTFYDYADCTYLVGVGVNLPSKGRLGAP